MKQLKRYAFGLAIFCLNMSTGYAQEVVGKWKTVDDDTGEPKSIVELYKKDGDLYGKVVQLLIPEDQGKRCAKCTGKEHNQPIEGMVIVKGLSKDTNNEYSGGTIFDPAKGKEYKCKIWIDKAQSNILNVRGYVAFLHRTQNWYRANE